MKNAYNQNWLHNLTLVKEAKQWLNHKMISEDQFTAIKETYPSGFYHPNFVIRILLFIATLIAMGGVTGLLVLMFVEVFEDAIEVLSIIYGLASFVVLEFLFISKNNHYKSGVTEALLYHCIGYTLGGMVALTDFNVGATCLFAVIIFSFTAFRYLDLVSTAIALGSLGYLVFYNMYEAGGIATQVIPFAFILLFTPLYFLFKGMKKKSACDPWMNCLILAESICLLFIYAAGNYLVVRELSVNLMYMELEPGQDIPFAFLFYFFTIAMPIAYLYFAIKNKDAVLLRVSLVVLAFSVFTFKFYFSLGHPEVTLTLAGAILLLISYFLFRYLKTPKNGFTRENILSDKWSNINAEAFIMSQTLGGNQVADDDSMKFGGGSFGGGGSGGNY